MADGIERRGKMIKKYWKTLLITSIIILLPIAVGLIFWNRLPEKLPTHWNVSGEIDGWSSKGFAVAGLPLIMLLLQWVCVIATCADPKKSNHPGKILKLVLWIVPFVSILSCTMIYTAAFGWELPVGVIMPMLIGVLLAVVGNYLPKCKQNYTIGIKIPWTLNSEENWNKTHRFAGWLWVAGGVIGALSGWIGLYWNGIFWIFIGVILVMVIAPIVYSYVLYKKGV